VTPYKHENNFLIFGLGLIFVAALGWGLGTTTGVDFAAALVAAYVVLRIVNTMQRAENKKK